MSEFVGHTAPGGLNAAYRMQERVRRGGAARRAALLVCFLAAVGCARLVDAAPLQLKLYVEYGLTGDSNVYRTSDPLINQIFLGTRRQGDLMHQSTLGAEARWSWSRQRFDLSGWVSRRRFEHFSSLNHTASSLSGAWRFEFGRRWSGTLGFDSQRRLQSFSDFGVLQPDQLTIRQPRLEVYYALTPKWYLHGRVGLALTEHGLATQRRFDRRVQRALAGLEYRKGSMLDIEGGIEYAHGEYPNRLPGDPLVRSYTQFAPFVRARWMYSGVSTFEGRLGYTQRSGRGGAVAKDFGGITGRLGYERRLSGATRLNIRLTRDIQSSDGIASNYVQDTGAGIDLGWTPTAKIGVGLRGGRHWLGYQTLGGAARRDVVDLVEARLTYAPVDFVTLSFNLGMERRGSNLAGAKYDTLYGGVLMRVSWENIRGAFDR